ncbi:MAG TPA: lamin tail domain-containing protein [Nannocystaceae bacterium]|nr:lamin tail domain-containing protein [Nannocystaceae bacterium]
MREPLPEICPDVAAGDLVITELHGEVGSDPKWIEITNRSAQTVDLFGLHVIIKNLSGTEGVEGIVRYSPPPLAPGGYFVLGIVPDVNLPDIVDYGLQGNHVNEADVPTAESESGTDAVKQENDNDPVVKMPDAGIITLEACDVMLDKVVYFELPEVGTRSFGGTPDADANDDENAWCTDDVVLEMMTGLGARGTPGEANRPCE